MSTANENGHSISTIDLGTGLVTTVSTRIAPHNVQASLDGRLLLAVGSVADMAAHGSGTDSEEDMARGRLLIFDTSTMDPGRAADVEVVAYCRGPYCVLADEAVRLLRRRGRSARRLADGFPEWRHARLPVETVVVSALSPRRPGQ